MGHFVGGISEVRLMSNIQGTHFLSNCEENPELYMIIFGTELLSIFDFFLSFIVEYI